MPDVRKPLGTRERRLWPAFAPDSGVRWVDIGAVPEWLQNDRLKVSIENECISDDCLDVVIGETKIDKRGNRIARAELRVVTASSSFSITRESLGEWRIGFFIDAAIGTGRVFDVHSLRS